MKILPTLSPKNKRLINQYFCKKTQKAIYERNSDIATVSGL